MQHNASTHTRTTCGCRCGCVRRYAPRLTAANYRYFIRGQNSRAAADDYRVKARRQAKLAPYDKLLRQFRYGVVAKQAGQGGSGQGTAGQGRAGQAAFA